MLILFATGAVALAAGTAVYKAVRRWPTADPAAPKGRTVAAEVDSHQRLASFLRRRSDPATATGLAMSVAVVGIAIGASVAGVLLIMVRRDTGLARWDIRPARWASENATWLSTKVLRAITELGGTRGVWLLAVVVAVVESRRIRSRSAIAFLALVIVGQAALVGTIKWAVDRARPDIDPLAPFGGASFPSGHSATAAAAFAAFALLLGRRRRLRTKAMLAGGAAAIAAAVAASRVLLGVHWFTDVVAGVSIGWGWFAVCSIAFGGRLLRFGAPVEVGVGDAPPATERELTRKY